ncbi:MAG TPA: metallophosphoesterase family protein [Ktedonobacteraceae bacterium]|nr:metallophosphoesterase family protein [Ktedonobacteraceae bacterium]
MRYAIFTDIHANLEALEAVLDKIDAISTQEPIDQIWFLGDLVGYGPNPNECILKLRARTDVIIAGNHDWAAVGKIDLEDFSPAARISAEWTAEQLTAEHRAFLENLPERLEKGECTLVHGSPYGPLWEYLTEETLAERSFEHFTSRYCFVGHTHVPVIFQQPDVANTPTIPLGDTGEFEAILHIRSNGVDAHSTDESAGNDDETTEMAAVRSPAQQLLKAQSDDENAASAFTEPGGEQQSDPETEESITAPDQNPSEATSTPVEDGNAQQDEGDDDSTEYAIPPRSDGESQGDRKGAETQGDRKGRPYNTTPGEADEPLFAEYGEESLASPEPEAEQLALLEADNLPPEAPAVQVDSEAPVGAASENTQEVATEDNEPDEDDDETTEFSLAGEDASSDENTDDSMQQLDFDDYMTYLVEEGDVEATTPESEIAGAEERLNGEIEELLTLLGLTQSMISVTNEMITPPEGHWEAPVGYRAIVNPGGVGQPRDGDPRAAFMIYDSEKGFEFYRIPYDFEKTQEKIINAGLPQFLAVRLQFGR